MMIAPQEAVEATQTSGHTNPLEHTAESSDFPRPPHIVSALQVDSPFNSVSMHDGEPTNEDQSIIQSSAAHEVPVLHPVEKVHLPSPVTLSNTAEENIGGPQASHNFQCQHSSTTCPPSQPSVGPQCLNEQTSDATDYPWAIADDDDDDEFLLQVQMQITQSANEVTPPEFVSNDCPPGDTVCPQRGHPVQKHQKAKASAPMRKPRRKQIPDHLTRSNIPKKSHCLPSIPPITTSTIQPFQTELLPHKAQRHNPIPTTFPRLPQHVMSSSPPVDSNVHDAPDKTCPVLLSWGDIPANMEVVDEGNLLSDPVHHNLHATPEEGNRPYLPPLVPQEEADDSALLPVLTTNEAKVREWHRHKQQLQKRLEKNQPPLSCLEVDKARRQADSDAQYHTWLARKKQQLAREKAAAVAKSQLEQNQRLSRLQAQAQDIHTIQTHTKERVAAMKQRKKNQPRRKQRKRLKAAPEVGEEAALLSTHELTDTMQRLDDVERVLAQVAARALRIPSKRS